MEDIKIRKRKDTWVEIDKLAPNPNNYWSVDFLKVWMILLVLLDHSVPHVLLGRFYSLIWERISIPVFMVVFGFNLGKSLARQKDQSLKSLYSWEEYFIPKIKRFLVPYAVIYGLSLLYLLLANIFIGSDFLLNVYHDVAHLPGLHNPYLKIALILPVWGPGNWFVPMLFLLILIFPFLYRLFTITRWSSWIMLLACYVIESAFQLSITIYYITYGYTPYINFFTFSPLMLLSAIGLGIWLSIDHRLDSPRNIPIWLLGLASLAYIISRFLGQTPEFTQWVVFDYNLWIYPWSALIVMLVINILPKTPHGPQFRFISTLGKSTYHILMTQIFYFSVLYGLLLPYDHPFGTLYSQGYGPLLQVHANYIWFYILNVLITFTIGTLWYLAGKRFWESRHITTKRISQKQMELMKAKGWINKE